MNAATLLILSLLFLASIFCQPGQKQTAIIEDTTPVPEIIN